MSEEETFAAQMAQAVGLKPHQLELAFKMVALDAARKLQQIEDVQQLSDEIGGIVADRLKEGDRRLFDWLAQMETVSHLAAGKIPKLKGMSASPRYQDILWGLNLFESENREKPTVAEFLRWLNAKRQGQKRPAISKADVAKACDAIDGLKERFTSARRGRPKKA